MLLFPAFQETYSGCCTVAAHLFPSTSQPYASTTALVTLFTSTELVEAMRVVSLPVFTLQDQRQSHVTPPATTSGSCGARRSRPGGSKGPQRGHGQVRVKSMRSGQELPFF